MILQALLKKQLIKKYQLSLQASAFMKNQISSIYEVGNKVFRAWRYSCFRYDN
ncbi:MAG: hypothetical protein L6U99_13325 [Clostridium sp.]|nr:MAG: hypothetical protein L6U99_13325 [Clostridium sp.]